MHFHAQMKRFYIVYFLDVENCELTFKMVFVDFQSAD